MRLLTLDDRGKLSCKEFSQGRIPPYAILSYTWGTEELSFYDVLEYSKGKAGYRKIIFCAEQAARDNLHYFWVDTCCIDERNNTELTKAINYMFRWYRSAAKSYVYLSDVSTSPRERNQELGHIGRDDLRSSSTGPLGDSELAAAAKFTFAMGSGRDYSIR
jgi:hypothetical protein